MQNQAIETPRQWRDGELEFTELIRQEYANCCFSAGMVDGHPLDTLYLQAEKDGVITTQLLLRPDEMAAIAWIASGVLWSVTIGGVKEQDSES
jgi:hypothetical protein